MTRTLAIIVAMMLGYTGCAVAETPTKSDLTTAVNSDGGCKLIPFATTRQTCITANAGIHGATSCDVAGACASGVAKAALTRCVTNRTASNNAFQSTINQLNTLKKGAWKDKKNQELKKLATDIIDKITPGQKSHADQLANAKVRLNACPRG